MIVYSDRRQGADPRALLSALRAGLGGPAPDRAALLIEAGRIEAGVADALCPEEDDEPPVAAALGAVVLDLAHAARGGGQGRLAAAAARLGRVLLGPLPARVELREPEGFAFYALYPETYAEAARRFLEAGRPERATVLGLRSIGTTLSAVVAAELEARGVPVRRLTARPRGHPWDRRLRLSPGLGAALGAGGPVLIVDEGPGISGSSFAAAAEAASAAGVPDGRIHLFPSWDPDGSGLRSGRARAVWPRARRWCATFEEAFLDSGRLAGAWGGGTVRDLSGGLWREVLCPPGRWPAAQPQHERRKYLLARDGEGPLLLRFAGLGARGRRALARAERQAQAGVAPPVEGLRDGFLAHPFLKGRPAEGPDAGVLGAIARYLGFLASTEGAVGAPRFDDILRMTRANVAEGLGEAAAGLTGWMEGLRAAVEARPAIAGDGRMLPQEWLRTERGVLKCDGIDHHDDHFWPGPQDLAWDLCGAAVEFGLDGAGREHLVAEVVARTGDRGLRRVLPFHEAAYLAWRLGYTSLAAETLAGSEDGRRMARDRDRYARLLRRALAR